MTITRKMTIMGAFITGALPFAAFGATKKAASESDEKYYTVLSSVDDYERVCKSRYPTVIVYNSSDCSACTMMEPALNKCARTYRKAKFYTINMEDEAMKPLHKKVKIEGYPTTHFIKSGKDPRIEQGSMGEAELDAITYEFVNDKRKSLITRATPPKKSLQQKRK